MVKVTIFCDGRNIDFEVPYDEGAIFISSCREDLLARNHDQEAVNAMSDDEVVKKAVGNMDYNSWHKQDRHSSHTALRDSDIKAESAEDTAIRNIEAENIRQFIYSRLPRSQADVYYMHVIKDLKFVEIAEILGDKADNVAKRFHRADKQMKKFKEKLPDPIRF